MALILDKTEQKIVDIIDAHRNEIIAFAKDIYTHAELGYKEYRTAEKFASFMKNLGLETKEGLAVTGVKAYLNEEEKTNVSLALIGELDALRIPEHKYANPETQGAHCCGHHAQLAGVIGAALALTNEDVKKELDGQVVFFAVPAEEYGEIEFKNSLTAQGKIRYAVENVNSSASVLLMTSTWISSTTPETRISVLVLTPTTVSSPRSFVIKDWLPTQPVPRIWESMH